MATFFAFLWAVASHWVTLMGGLVAVVLTVRARIKGADVANRVFSSIALVCVFVASFQAWSDEHVTAERAREGLARSSGTLPLENRAHNLAGAIRKFAAEWAAKPLPDGEHAEDRMDEATVERYLSGYSGRVRELRDEFEARGLQDTELNRLCDEMYHREDIPKVAERLDALADRLNR